MSKPLFSLGNPFSKNLRKNAENDSKVLPWGGRAPKFMKKYTKNNFKVLPWGIRAPKFVRKIIKMIPRFHPTAC